MRAVKTACRADWRLVIGCFPLQSGPKSDEVIAATAKVNATSVQKITAQTAAMRTIRRPAPPVSGGRRAGHLSFCVPSQNSPNNKNGAEKPARYGSNAEVQRDRANTKTAGTATIPNTIAARFQRCIASSAA